LRAASSVASSAAAACVAARSEASSGSRAAIRARASASRADSRSTAARPASASFARARQLRSSPLKLAVAAATQELMHADAASSEPSQQSQTPSPTCDDGIARGTCGLFAQLRVAGWGWGVGV